jgi:hypothetical protein
MKEVKDYSDIELKAIGYDLAIQAEKIQNDLRTISVELQRRAEASAATPEIAEVKSEEVKE